MKLGLGSRVEIMRSGGEKVSGIVVSDTRSFNDRLQAQWIMKPDGSEVEEPVLERLLRHPEKTD